MEELYEMKISHPILEQRFFESNTNRNRCWLNLKEIIQKEVLNSIP